MHVQVLQARLEQSRQNLSRMEASPAKTAAMRRLAQDEMVLGSARGESVEEMERLAERAVRIERSAAGTGLAVGLGLGGVVAWQLAAQGAGPLGILGGLSAGLLPGLVLARLAHDGAQSWTSRHVQTPGVGAVIERWKAPAPPSLPAASPAGRDNELTRLLDEIRTQVVALPEGPEKAAALASLELDRSLAGQARGESLESMQAGCQRARIWAVNGGRIGLGLGLALTGALAGLMLTDPTVGPVLALAGTAGGGFLSTVVLRSVGHSLGRDLGARFEKVGVEDLLQRWGPLLQERREQARSIREEASRLSAGGPSAAVQVENGGLRVGGVFIRSRER